jgi:DNA modification methylase
MTVRVLRGDCREHLAVLAASGQRVHAVVTDPPYHLTAITQRFGKEGAAPAKHGTDGAFARASKGFMGKTWDGGDVAFQPETWRLVFEVMHPGAHLFAFGGTRRAHRMVCAIEDAGFEIRETFMWVYGSGMPKSHNVAKAIDKMLGREGEAIPTVRMIPGADQNEGGSWIKDNGRTYQPHEYVPASEEAAAWQGWGTAVKPSLEPIVLARRPLVASSVARNVLLNGCGAINIDDCRIPLEGGQACQGEAGRWPANLLHDGSDEVMHAFAAFGERTSGKPSGVKHAQNKIFGNFRAGDPLKGFGDTGSAARFFFSAKADADDRAGSSHPTVKPTDLMRWLVQMVTPPGGTVLDPFAGTGSTGLAADQLGRDAILIEQDAAYVEDIKRKITGDAGLFAELLP